MNEEGFLRLVRGETRGPLAFAGRMALSAASGLYRVGAGTRNLAFDRGWKTTYACGVPVVSVGNLTLGGTGKTPMVEWIARWYRRRGVRVAILSRGYGNREGMNDEGRVLEENLPDVPHLQGRDRVGLAKIAVEELETELIVLDDGFQHRRLARDLDIVLLDALDAFGLGRIFPRGLLREPVSSLRRAGLVVLSRADLVDDDRRSQIQSRVREISASLPWIEARHAPVDVIDAEEGREAIESLSGRLVAAFCGIGNPEGFRRTLERTGVIPIGFRPFPDHHQYTSADIEEIARWAGTLGADLLLTTQKDLVKIRAIRLGSVPLRALRIGLEISEGHSILEESLARLLPEGTPR